MSELRPFYEQVQSHYDLSNDFFALFLDPARVYSCAYFAREGMTLEEAQQAKIDLALGKCDLRPGQRLLDIGCGWGAVLRRAAEAYGVRVVGLTLSREQFNYVNEKLDEWPGDIEVRLQGWEEFDEPVDRIVSIGAFEHFRQERYAAFFEKCLRLLPSDGRMLLHTIVWPEVEHFVRLGNSLTPEDLDFFRFINREIFPHGQLSAPSLIRRHAQAAGFRITREQSLQPHYARTLDCWAANLSASREMAMALTSPETYETYLRYLTGCAHYYRREIVDLIQFTLMPDAVQPSP